MKRPYQRPEIIIVPLDKEFLEGAGGRVNTGNGFKGDGTVGAGDIEAGEGAWDEEPFDDGFQWDM